MEEIYNNLTNEFNIAKSDIGLKGTSALSGLFNLFLCFFGYRYHRFLIAVAGFIVGAEASYRMLVGVTMDSAAKMLIYIIAGLVCSLIAYSFYRLGVVVLVFAATYNIVLPLITNYVGTTYSMYIAIVAGLLVGFIALRLMRPVIIIATGLSGGLNAVSAFAAIFGYTNSTVLLVVGIVVAVLGILYQFKNTVEQ